MQVSASVPCTSATVPAVADMAILPLAWVGGSDWRAAGPLGLAHEVDAAGGDGAAQRGRLPAARGAAGVILDRPPVDGHRRGAAVGQLDEVVGQRGAGVAPAAVDLVDHQRRRRRRRRLLAPAQREQDRGDRHQGCQHGGPSPGPPRTHPLHASLHWSCRRPMRRRSFIPPGGGCPTGGGTREHSAHLL